MSGAAGLFKKGDGMKETFVEASRASWTPRDPITLIEQINCGCLQRIADALERIGSNYQQLIDYKAVAERKLALCSGEIDRLKASNSDLRGVIARLKAQNQTKPATKRSPKPVR